MKLLIVIIVNGRVECSVTLSERASLAIDNERTVQLPRFVTDALTIFERTVGDEFSTIDLASLGRMAACCGHASVASKDGRIDVHRVDKTEGGR